MLFNPGEKIFFKINTNLSLLGSSLFLACLAFSTFSYSKEIIISPGDDSQERLQEAMILMSEGDTLVIKSGYYSFEDGLSLDVDNVIITGEGGSGGALAIGVGDHISMLQYSIYSVASPEACASIVWRDGTKAQEAAEAMKLDAKNLLDFGLVDTIIEEPLGGAHRDTMKASNLISQEIDRNLKLLNEIDLDDLIEKRYKKIMSYGSI